MTIEELKQKIDGLGWSDGRVCSIIDIKSLSADHTRLAEQVARYEKLVETVSRLEFGDAGIIEITSNGWVRRQADNPRVGYYESIFDAFEAYDATREGE